MALLTALIDKQDNNEIIRDQIAAILAIEEANQRALAVSESKNPNEWKFGVYTERSRPFEVLTDNEDGEEIGEMPLVNILFDSDNFDNTNSDQTYRRRTKGNFFIDCYGHKNRTDNYYGDELTSKESDRIARLVRNIIDSAEYYQLALGYRELGKSDQIVTRRRFIRREKFFPSDREGMANENIIVTRLTLEVEYDEFAPQIETRDLGLLITTCRKDSITGQIYFDVENDFTGN